ncbi:alkaline phosphatase family protein [Pseudonocardia abyssalis]|uniref:Alkaline phosphatase family protein n=1 Tax=Pseudonocardia abyssalis TaxID=2792008 RepID=A0ABS6UZW8_9PSEU|nr:alkaline phosphatase family protein [Pseudonocardia abyssalis]MBW0117121.1 alkaline phosphatase family protein [Pseudonocardia abyssalis]MBW0137814.1 alkaline phosphatase family protein [Pseudonocardia abyssalis]
MHALGMPEPASDLVVEPVRAAALLLVDGLGRELLDAHAADAPFLASLPDAGPLTVGFPSSTSISLASLGTGLPPGAHGLLGITFRLDGELLDSLKWTSHGTGRPVDLRESQPPEQVQPAPTALERAAAAGIGVTVVSNQLFRGSGLTRAALRGGRFRGVHALGDLAAEVLAALAGPERRLCYGYHADLDAMGHLHGPGSLAWRLQLSQVDRLAERIVENLPPDAVLAVTGDHGMVSVDRIFDADTDEALQRGVLLLGGDPRARHVYARRGAADDVLAAWRAVLGDAAWVVPGEQAVADGWFGPVSPGMRDRVGDVVVATRGTTAVIRSEAEPLISTMPGQHGSLTSAEQLVPLLLATG